MSQISLQDVLGTRSLQKYIADFQANGITVDLMKQGVEEEDLEDLGLTSTCKSVYYLRVWVLSVFRNRTTKM